MPGGLYSELSEIEQTKKEMDELCGDTYEKNLRLYQIEVCLICMNQ